LFAPHFHQVGFLHCVSGEASTKAVETLKRFQKSAEKHPVIAKKVVQLNGPKDIKDRFWWYEESTLPGWHGYVNHIDGYAHSGNALKSVHRACMKNGVKFILGQDGAVSEVLYQNASHGRRAVGVKSITGRIHVAKLVIVAAGAGSSKIVPEVGRQLVAKSWSVAHVHLTDEETSALRGIPVTYARDLGFFFEPDPKTNLLKLCPMGAGFINTDSSTGVSHAPESLKDSAFVPPDDEAQIRKLLTQTLPSLADRPLVKKSLCWFADTRDSDFIIDYVPDTNSSVMLLSGDSGHGFKMFPIVGEWIRNVLEAPDGRQPVARWRWKEPQGDEGGNWGSDVSWRLGESREFADIRPAAGAKL
jgi:sarcosine oxidase / L-pipecolate oxidase